MSERRTSDGFFESKWLSVLLLVLGMVLLWLGNQEYQQFQAEVADYVLARPDNRTVWFLILGSAATIAGATGLLRDNVR